MVDVPRPVGSVARDVTDFVPGWVKTMIHYDSHLHPEQTSEMVD